MPEGYLTQTMKVAGVSMSSSITREETGQISHEVTLPAGKSGTLSTRTDDNTGILTLAEGHGITDSDTIDVFWSGGLRYGVDVTSVDGTAVSIDLGDGDNLPTQGTAVVATVQVEIDTDFDGDLLVMFGAACNKRAHLHFTEEDDTSVKAVELTADEGFMWASSQDYSNPLTGEPVGKIQATCGEAAAGTLKIGALYDSA